VQKQQIWMRREV